MKEEIRHIVVGVVKSFTYAGGIKASQSVIPLLTEADNWVYVDSKSMIVNNETVWCYQYQPPEDTEDYFLQVELCTQFSTVVSINVITNEEDRVTAYSK